MLKRGQHVDIIFWEEFRDFYKFLPWYIDMDYGRKLELFMNYPFNPVLHTHRLAGKLSNYHSFYLIRGYRVVFRFISYDKVLFYGYWKT